MRVALLLVCLGCSSPAKPPVAEPTSDNVVDPPVAEAPEAAAAPPAIEWRDVRSWDGLFVIGIPQRAQVNEYLMALVPIRGNDDAIDFMVRIENLPVSSKSLIAYQPIDGAKTTVAVDDGEHVQFTEQYVEGAEARTARHDVVIQRGKTMAVVWESIYRHAKPDTTAVAIQSEMAQRFRVEKTPP